MKDILERLRRSMDDFANAIRQMLQELKNSLETVRIWLEIVWFYIRLRAKDISANYLTRNYMNWIDAVDGTVSAIYLLPPPVDKIWGFDCSHWNGPVDMSVAVMNNARFCFIKACDGAVKTNWYEENSKAAEAVGLPFGPYFWLYPASKVSINAQVSAWWNVYKAYGRVTLPPVIDWEWTRYAGAEANPTIGDLRAAVTAWLSISGGIKPLIYTAPGYSSQYGPITDDVIEMSAGLWVAHYGTEDPIIPANFTTYIVHQDTDEMDGSFVGYDPMWSHAADRDIFNGTEQEFLEWVNSGSIPIEPDYPPNITPYDNGVTTWEGRTDGSTYRIIFVESSAIDWVQFIADETCHKISEPWNAHIAFNATPSPVGACKDIGFGVRSEGIELYPLNDRWNPFFGWDPRNECFIGHKKEQWPDLEVATQGYRYIVDRGLKGVTSDAWDLRAPRRVLCEMYNGDTVIFSSKGRTLQERGMTLHEVADFLMNEVHVYSAIDLDSGRNVNDWINIGDETGDNKLYFSGTGDDEPIPVVGLIKLKKSFGPTDPTLEYWKLTALTKIGIFATPELNGHVRGTRLKGWKVSGTLVGNDPLFLKFDDHKYAPVRDSKRKWATLEGPLGPPVEPPPDDIWRVKKWGEDDIMIENSYNTANIHVGNFQVVTMLVPDSDVDPFYQADQVHMFLRIPRSDIDRLYEMQVPDYNWKGELQTREMKMNWLCQFRGRPYLQKENTSDWEWPTAPYILWGEMAYGGQLVEAIGYKTVRGNYRGVTKDWECAIIRGITKAEWESGTITHESHPYLIQKATAADRGAIGENLYNDTPKGTIFAPLWAPNEWFFQGLAGYQPKEWLMPLDVLTRDF